MACPVSEDAHDEEKMVQFLKVNGIYDDVRHFMFAVKGAFKEVQHHEPGANWVENLFHVFQDEVVEYMKKCTARLATRMGDTS
jgi:hypothetical protein